MILFPNCKINLGLRVTAKRPDSYHDIETIFYPLPLKDALELTPLPAGGTSPELVISGLPVAGDPQSNLCLKAWQLIKQDFPDVKPVQIHLLKGIPAGAGLGGGSSDGAHTLLLLNEMLSLGLSKDELLAYALRLGSDCPFFILNTPCLATGRGEIMQEIAVKLTGYYFVLVDPEVHISTARAFSKIKPGSSDDRRSLAEIISLPVEEWKGQLINEFEPPVFEEYESLKIIREELYASGAAYASMTGTGSCLYGIFPANKDIRLNKITDQHKVHNLKPNR